MFLAFVHGFAGVTVINISYLMPTTVLIRESWLLMWLGEVCISGAMHLTPRVCTCCGSWILTVGEGLGLGCWLLADICPWFGSMLSEFVHWFAHFTVIKSHTWCPPLSWSVSHGFWCDSVRDAYLLLGISPLESAVAVARGSWRLAWASVWDVGY